MTEKYGEARDFHKVLVEHPAIRRDETGKTPNRSELVVEHRDGAAALERELVDRMKVTPRAVTPSSGTSSGHKTYHSTSTRRSSSGMPVLILLGAIFLLALYIGFFDDNGESKIVDAENGAIAESTPSSSNRAPIPEPTRRSTGPINFFNQVIAGYDQLVAGRLAPDIPGTSLSSVVTSLQGQGVESASFSGADLPLKGASIVSERGKKLASYIYGEKETLLYAMELPMAMLKNEDGFYVASDILAMIEAGETVYTPAPSNGTIALYRENETVYIVAANRSEPDLKRLIGH